MSLSSWHLHLYGTGGTAQSHTILTTSSAVSRKHTHTIPLALVCGTQTGLLTCFDGLVMLRLKLSQSASPLSEINLQRNLSTSNITVFPLKKREVSK